MLSGITSDQKTGGWKLYPCASNAGELSTGLLMGDETADAVQDSNVGEDMTTARKSSHEELPG
jgi:hypothetical protein